MDKHGKLRVVFGLVLGAAAAFACLSLVSHHPGDPGGGDWDASGRVHNWCGVVGAYFSGFLVEHFGFAATGFAVGLAVFWAWVLLAGDEKQGDALLKIAGSLLLVVTISGLSALAGGGHYFSSIVGSTIAAYAGHYFGRGGAYLVVSLAAILSLLLATDFMVLAPAGRLLVGAVRFLRALGARTLGMLTRRRVSPPAVRPARKVTRPDEAESAETPQVAPPPAEKPAPPRPPTPARPKKAPVARAEAAKAPDERGYTFPPLSLLEDGVSLDGAQSESLIRENAEVLKATLAEFGISVEVVGIETGPVITQYEVSLAPGIKVNRVISLTDDIAMALKAPSVRIVAPIPGRDSIGVEVPNSAKAIVRLKGLLSELEDRKIGRIPLYMGRDAKGEPLFADLSEMPHLLIAGTTGSGKSVCINSIVLSILMQKHPDDVKLLLVDPKMVELSHFKDLPHLICPVVTDLKKAAAILEWACVQMDQRYDWLAGVGVRHISRYNRLGPKGIREKLRVPADAEIDLPDHMPYIVIIIDELADLMMVAAKDVEHSITRLAQKSRAVGIHLVLATQRPSVDVITGLIKSNLPARVSFKVFSRIDSRTILDQNGAEKLLGEGDMLFLPPATARLIRAQGTFVSDEEIRRVSEHVKKEASPDYDDELVEWRAESSFASSGGCERSSGKDELFDDAVRIVIEHDRGSVSLLQRRLEIGYGRAARIIDQMAEEGIVGPYQGSQAREVLWTFEQFETWRKQQAGAAT